MNDPLVRRRTTTTTMKRMTVAAVARDAMNELPPCIGLKERIPASMAYTSIDPCIRPSSPFLLLSVFRSFLSFQPWSLPLFASFPSLASLLSLSPTSSISFLLSFLNSLHVLPLFSLSFFNPSIRQPETSPFYPSIFPSFPRLIPFLCFLSSYTFM